MERLLGTLRRTLAIALLVLLGASTLHAGLPLLVYDFTLDLTPAENVDHVRSLGFSGLVTRVKDQADVTKLREYAAHVATLDDFELLAYVVYDFGKTALSEKLWHAALPVLASAEAPLWIVVKKAPSTPALRELLGRMAREAQDVGVRTVIYPHWNTSIETAAEASALIAEIGQPNLANSIHTCHEIRGGHQYEMETVVAEHADETALVAIAGADENAYAGPPGLLVTWDDVIKPLDEGDYSLLPFLQALHDAGYDGPVILQTFGITDDPGHLERSLRRYAEYLRQIESPGDADG
ncbi:MAG: sugar phosphate isomerase/epimerase [Planctomycetes bacterium]|nr:sugar phosphate isomerase/epimerase [Planctomycetota bacterium]